PVIGDILEPKLGVETELPRIDHFFHLAAIYDMGADEERNAQLNIGGTKNAIDLANALDVGRFHHMSSIAVAGDFDDGTFNEDMFDEG
ncbi:SDR family oxidoreductase, partial [Escherichia coli]|uniref:SDR family oxidoreductase n=1 Tax=Escherichia coli TaxID=562 RepID=UPI002115B92E